ncbi:WXG100 family type VII secretion target, partial [Kibdelosporangium lantanae]
MDFQSFMAAQPTDDDHLADLGAKVQTSGVTGENSSTPVLAAGKPGLRFFADFGPAYTKLTGANHDYQKDIANRYEEQGEINYTHLRTDAERYAQIQTQVDDILNSVRNNGNSVFGAWQGTAADTANAHFTEFLDQGRRTLTQFGTLASTITVVVDAVDRICFEKAAAVKSLTADRIGPCAKSDVDFLVDFAGRCAAGDFSDEELTRVANLCGLDVTPTLCRTNPRAFEKVSEDVNGWLTTIFVPFYEARLAKFDAACTAAKDTLAIA